MEDSCGTCEDFVEIRPSLWISYHKMVILKLQYESSCHAFIWHSSLKFPAGFGRNVKLSSSPGGNRMARIGIIEDELKIQQIVKAYLEKEGFEVCTATDGRQGLELLKTEKLDLVILDLMLPVIPGEQLLTYLRQTSEIPVIILSAKTSEDERIFGLNIGADDYLIKPFSPRELVARVYAHLRRARAGAAPSGTVLSFDHRELLIDISKHEVLIQDHPVTLTPTEFRILQVLAQTPGLVYSRSQLVEKVQGYSYAGYDRTIDSHIKNLRQKIESNPETPGYILTVFGVGYKFGGVLDE